MRINAALLAAAAALFALACGSYEPAPTPDATAPAASPTPIPPPNLRHIEEKRYMIELINKVREGAGVGPVELGDNIAAQAHAELMLRDCFDSHWGLDGLKPYMRYSLAGGYQSNWENVAVTNGNCSKAWDGYAPITGVMEEIALTMGGLMESPGHRDNILHKHHKKVNIGFAWDEYNFHAAQHFEGDYAEYSQLPRIDGNRLSFRGRVKNGARINASDLGVFIDYDPPPHALTRGQAARTYCYGGGAPVATLIEPPSDGWSYTGGDEFEDTYESCLDPYDAPPKESITIDELEALRQEAYDESANPKGIAVVGLWITADEWSVMGGEFSVSADIGNVLNRWGDGVYTIVLHGWGAIDGEDATISEYSIFHGVAPPNTYYPR